MRSGVLIFFWIWTAILFKFTTMAVAHTMERGDGASATVQSCREFSSHLHKAIAHAATGNMVDSPLSVYFALSCLLRGSDKETAREIREGLRLLTTERLDDDHADLVAKLKSSGTFELSLANAIFLQKGVQLVETFRIREKDSYNLTVQNVDFSDNVETASKINSWSSTSTNGRIENIVSSDDIDEYTKLVLASAVYLKGQWKYRFNAANIKHATFHLTKERSTRVPMMFKELKYRQGQIPSFDSRFIVLPYADDRFDMLIILPNEIDGLRLVEENFDWNVIVNATNSERLTHLYLPKFKIEATIDLKNILVELGFTAMFGDRADFTKMSDFPLKVSSVLQKAFIEVNELGTEAAATTVVQMRLKRSLDQTVELPNKFVVDRPFIVAVRHVPTDVPLFVASVREIGTTPDRDEL